MLAGYNEAAQKPSLAVTHETGQRSVRTGG
jgi:hypothetical protein